MTKTCSLELSQRLWEKGLRIQTAEGWNLVGNLVGNIWMLYDMGSSDCVLGKTLFPAYSTDELWEVLPEIIKDHTDTYPLRVLKEKDRSIVWYVWLITFSDSFLCEALGLLVEWCLDNGYINKKGEPK